MHNRPLTSTLVHLTYNLKGSIPGPKLEAIGKEYRNAKYKLNKIFPISDRHEGSIRYTEYSTALTKLAIKYYLAYDGMLDQSVKGPHYLQSAKAKRIVIDSWHHLAKLEGLEIYAICVMSNHAHVILRVADERVTICLKDLMDRHKHFTATQVNKLQGKKGRRVWAVQVWDRDIRPGKFHAVLWYVLNNPKKAGLTTGDILDWSGNWYDPRLEEEYIRPYRAA